MQQVVSDVDEVLSDVTAIKRDLAKMDPELRSLTKDMAVFRQNVASLVSVDAAKNQERTSAGESTAKQGRAKSHLAPV